MEEYKPNSFKYKAEQKQKQVTKEDKKIEKVINSTAKVKKKSSIHKFTDVFISEDASNVKSYILSDVLVPALKKLVTDIVKDGIDIILYGGARRGGSGNTSRASYVSYNNYSNNRNDRSLPSSRNGLAYSYNDIVLENRGEAEDVLTRMDELIDMYGEVSVADLYDLVGITGNYTDNKYGWTNIRNAEPVRVRDGYLLKMPKPGPLKS